MANTVRLGNFSSTLLPGYPWLQEARDYLRKLATWADSPPRTDTGAAQVLARKNALASQVRTLATFLGFSMWKATTVTAAVTTLTGIAPSGTYTTTVTINTNPDTGVVTSIVLS